MERREVEIKLLVEGPEAIARVLAVLEEREPGRGPGRLPRPPRRPETVRQVNHFFDTPDLALVSGRMALRLREEGGRFLLTAKGEGSVVGALADRPEEEVAIDRGLAAEILAGRVAPLSSLRELLPASRLLAEVEAFLAGREVACAGSFANERTRVGARLVGMERDVVVELDRTSLPGGRVDCEVEVEVPHGCAAEDVSRGLAELLRRAGVEGRPASSKARRFFEALGSAGG